MRGRFAPSPTGDLHLGNARTALLAWLQVRSAGGQFVLRVEDLDPGRCRPEYLEGQLADLRWLGLDWDEGPDVGGGQGAYLQTQRSGLYAEALEHLQKKRLLFDCFCSRREIAAAASAPHAGDEEGPPYPGTCLAMSEVEREVRRKRGPAAVRMLVPERELCFDDEIAGRRCYNPAAETGPFVVRRKDGVAAYQLAVVVDDHEMRITHVLRGADLLSSTVRQLLIYEALGWAPPAWAHVPLLLGSDGARLAKRHGAVTLRELRESGVAPERVVGWLASTCGLNEKGGEAEAASLISSFDLARLPREPTVIDRLPFSSQPDSR